jgi:hypothetical protein
MLETWSRSMEGVKVKGKGKGKGKVKVDMP